MSLPFAIDASVVMNWCFEDERTPDVADLFQSLASTYALAPALLIYEVQNALRSAERRQRISSRNVDSVWIDLGILDLRIVPHPEIASTARLLDLSRRYGITVYDASYLDIAMRFNLPLATSDRELCAAARIAGVPLLLPEPS